MTKCYFFFILSNGHIDVGYVIHALFYISVFFFKTQIPIPSKFPAFAYLLKQV